MATKTEKMLATKAATRARRATQDLRVRELKIVNASLSALQKEKLERTFLEAKWLRNSIVAHGIFNWTPAHGVQVKLKDGTLEERKLTTLHSQSRQKLQQQLQANVKTLASQRAAGRPVGAIRFTNRVNSVEWPSGAVKVTGSKAKLPIIGSVRVRGGEQLGDEIANARLVRRASGYYLLVTSLTPKESEPEPKLEPLGLDFGVKTHITLSDGTEWNISVEEPERLRRLQRKLGRQVKGSNNRERTLRQLSLSYERLSAKKEEAANQLVASLKDHSLVAYQDENLRGRKAQRGFGRVVHHSAMGRVKAKLSRLPQAVKLERFAPTTQLCPECGTLNKLTLSERTYSCGCGYAAPRDIHAARNMVLLAQHNIYTPAERGGAPVEGRTAATRRKSGGKSTPVKQETSVGAASPR